MYRLGASVGLHPAPAVVPAAGRQPQRQRQKLVSCGRRDGILLWWVSTLVDTVDLRHAWMSTTRSVDGWNRLGI
ncbi:hypothetical protein DI041_01720 [Stenotrophomonas maltophilia]|nr:hypothetical protein DI034_14595 [Stenotrophomonas maltophilia]TIE64753.1 hypothetical protein DI041_01720 [Stenotrophomonas maltophilia]